MTVLHSCCGLEEGGISRKGRCDGGRMPQILFCVLRTEGKKKGEIEGKESDPFLWRFAKNTRVPKIETENSRRTKENHSLIATILHRQATL